MITFSLTAQLPSDKNQVGITTRGGRVQRFPNKRFLEWRRQAAKEVMTQVPATGKLQTGPLYLVVDYVPSDARMRDVDGMLGALGHLCEYCGLIDNDGQIKSVNWLTLPQRTVPHTTIALYRIDRQER